MSQPWRLLVFGATGAVGGTIVSHACQAGWEVIGASRGFAANVDGRYEHLQYDPLAEDGEAILAGQRPFNAVCFAQGANCSDAVGSLDVNQHMELYRANCLSVVVALSALVRACLLSKDGARIVVISSIWQERARANKLSYTMTKAAIGGLVRSASVDLGAAGHLVNAVLPGVLDTPMTRAQLSADQIAAVSAKTTLSRLPDLATLADTALFLCSANNRSINGQSLAVDLGMINASLI